MEKKENKTNGKSTRWLTRAIADVLGCSTDGVRRVLNGERQKHNTKFQRNVVKLREKFLSVNLENNNL